MRSLWLHTPHAPWFLSAPIKETAKLPQPTEVTQEAPVSLTVDTEAAETITLFWPEELPVTLPRFAARVSCAAHLVSHLRSEGQPVTEPHLQGAGDV